MSLTERQRHDAYAAMQGTFGDRTDIVIDMLRPAHDLATKDDLAVTSGELRAEMAGVRTEMADLRTDMADLRTELKSDMAELRTELRTGMAGLRTEMADLRTDFTAGIHEATTSQTRVLLFGMIGAVVVSGAMNSMALVLG